MNPALVATFNAMAHDLATAFGVVAVHTRGDGDEASVRIILGADVVAVGEFGERMEAQTTAQVPAASGAKVGDTFTVAGIATDEDPYPDDAVWIAAQLLSDDGYMRAFAVRPA